VADVLDGPVINALNQAVQQNYGDRRQAIDNARPASKARGSFPASWANWTRAATEADPRSGHVFAP